MQGTRSVFSRTAIAAVALWSSGAVPAADLARETRLANELRGMVEHGEPLLLQTAPPAPPTAPAGRTAATSEPAAPPDEGDTAEPGAADDGGGEPIPVPEGLAIDEDAEGKDPASADEPPAATPEAADGAPDGPEVFALYMPAARTPAGGVVLLHDLDGHPDWPEVIRPLRLRLPRAGWATLSVQMPLPARGAGRPAALIREALPRIDAAVTELEKRGDTPVILVGHGLGAAMAAGYLGARDGRVGGFIGLSMGVPGPESVEPAPHATLAASGTPALCLYGSEAPRFVLDAMTRLDGSGVTRHEVVGADHAFGLMSDSLTQRVRGWLHQRFVAEGTD